MENKRTLEIVEIHLWENEGLVQAQRGWTVAAAEPGWGDPGQTLSRVGRAPSARTSVPFPKAITERCSGCGRVPSPPHSCFPGTTSIPAFVQGSLGKRFAWLGVGMKGDEGSEEEEEEAGGCFIWR